MTDCFFTIDAILAAAGSDLPASLTGLNKRIRAEGWREREGKARRRPGRGGGWEYHADLLPGPVQVRLGVGRPAEAHEALTPNEQWERFERLTAKQKARAKERLEALDAVDQLLRGGMSATRAIAEVGRTRKIATRSLHSWRQLVHGVPRADWLPALAPQYKAGGRVSDCHEAAWAALKADFLRPEEPAFSACYRRVSDAAEAQGWEPLPTEAALRRRMDREVPQAVQIMARAGRDAAKAIYPHQTRSVASMHAMQAVNFDGHKFDVFVRVPDRDKPVRVFLVAIQDLFSRKFLAWRLARSENKDAVRLVIGDMVERHGIPDEAVLDNGRAFASKWITGGAPNRYRFKVRDEDPSGLLTTLGINIHWSTPYAGQSKPIERGFRDLCETIAKHPICAGAWTGNHIDAKPENYASKAVPIEVFAAHVDEQMRLHNARTGRRTEMADGGSFDEAFERSLADPQTIVRWPSQAQKSLWLLAADAIRLQRGNGEIHFFKNRYWHPALTQHAGKSVTVRFDPERLHEPMKVYDRRDRLICDAACIEKVGFLDSEAARDHAAKRNAYLRTLREHQRMHQELTVDELARIYADGAPAMSEPERVAPKVVRLATGTDGPMVDVPDRATINEQFARGFRILTGGLDED